MNAWGAVLRYGGDHLVDFDNGEIGRLLMVQSGRTRSQQKEYRYILRLVEDIRKVCTCCGEAKILADFYDGRRSYCAACMRRLRRQRYARG